MTQGYKIHDRYLMASPSYCGQGRTRQPGHYARRLAPLCEGALVRGPSCLAGSLRHHCDHLMQSGRCTRAEFPLRLLLPARALLIEILRHDALYSAGSNAGSGQSTHALTQCWPSPARP